MSIDSIIDRGAPDDWDELLAAIIQDDGVLERVEKVCERNKDHPYSPSRYRYFLNFVRFEKKEKFIEK